MIFMVTNERLKQLEKEKMKTKTEQRMEDLEEGFYKRLCPICKKHLQNNCSKCNLIKEIRLEAVNEMIEFLEIQLDRIKTKRQTHAGLQILEYPLKDKLQELKEEKKRLGNKQ